MGGLHWSITAKVTSSLFDPEVMTRSHGGLKNRFDTLPLCPIPCGRSSSIDRVSNDKADSDAQLLRLRTYGLQ
jgi:hypothetical protein